MDSNLAKILILLILFGLSIEYLGTENIQNKINFLNHTGWNGRLILFLVEKILANKTISAIAFSLFGYWFTENVLVFIFSFFI